MITVPAGFELGYGSRLMNTVFTADVNNAAPSNVFDIDDPSTHLPYVPTASQIVARSEDLQRGETLLTLLDASGNPVQNSNGAPVYLRVVYVGRVMVDPSSDYVLEPSTQGRRLTQNVIYFDVPTGLVPDGAASIAFGVRVQRIRRSASNIDAYEVVPQGLFEDAGFVGAAAEWIGWNSKADISEAADPIPILIADAPEPEANEAASFSGTAGAEAMPTLSTSVASLWSNAPYTNSQRTNLFDVRPNPEVRFSMPAPLDESTTPAAFTMDVEYPSAKMEVVNVRLLRRNPNGALVLWSAPPKPSSPCIADPQQRDTLSVQVADPEPDYLKRAYGFAVAYRLVNTKCGAAAQNPSQRVMPGEITPGPIQAYQLDGQPLAVAPPIAIASADLR